MTWEQRLSKSDYIEFGYVNAKDKSDEDFSSIEKQAQRQIEAATNYFYDDHDFSNDWPKRVDAYKAAICEQVDFILETGITASYDGGDNFKNVSIGRLSLSPSVNPVDTTVNGVFKEASRILGRYGLLYRGVNDYAAKNK